MRCKLAKLVGLPTLTKTTEEEHKEDDLNGRHEYICSCIFKLWMNEDGDDVSLSNRPNEEAGRPNLSKVKQEERIFCGWN